jgi:hypothetical protein
MLSVNPEVGYTQYFAGPVASGQGGAGRAAVEDGEQFLLNPASLAHAIQTTSSVFYFDGYLAEKEKDKSIGVTLTDAEKDNAFNGAFTFVDRKRNFQNKNLIGPSITEKYFNYTLAQFAFSQLAFGVSASLWQITVKEDNSLIGFEDEYDQWDMSAGLHWNPNPEFGVGLVFYNILPRDKDIPQILQNQDSIATGVYYIFYPYLRGRLDVGRQLTENTEGKTWLQIGLETKPQPYLLWRIGFNQNELLDRKYWTMGITFDGPRLKIDYFYQKNIDDSEGAMHGVDFRLPFW